MPDTPSAVSRRNRRAAYISWAKTDDPTARTARAREAFESKFLREADADGTLSPSERARKAAALRKAYYLNLAEKSAQARRTGGDEAA